MSPHSSPSFAIFQILTEISNFKLIMNYILSFIISHTYNNITGHLSIGKSKLQTRGMKKIPSGQRPRGIFFIPSAFNFDFPMLMCRATLLYDWDIRYNKWHKNIQIKTRKTSMKWISYQISTSNNELYLINSGISGRERERERKINFV